MFTRAVLLGAAFATVAVACASLSAQRAAPLSSSQFNQLDCTFKISGTATWEGAEPKARVSRDLPLEFRIGNIDSTRGSADFMLGSSARPLVMVFKRTTLNFIEPPDGGETAITSVVVTDGAKRFPASYSQTAYYAYSGAGFTSAPRANQYYGYCVPGRASRTVTSLR